MTKLNGDVRGVKLLWRNELRERRQEERVEKGRNARKPADILQ
jgi:hypothetical protein